MTSPELLAAGFDHECDDCHAAVRRDLEACERHYVPTHERPNARACPTCGGSKDADEDTCGRCRAAGV